MPGYPDAGDGWRNLPAAGMYLRHIAGLVVDDATFAGATREARSPIVEVDVR